MEGEREEGREGEEGEEGERERERERERREQREAGGTLGVRPSARKNVPGPGGASFSEVLPSGPSQLSCDRAAHNARRAGRPHT